LEAVGIATDRALSTAWSTWTGGSLGFNDVPTYGSRPAAEGTSVADPRRLMGDASLATIQG